jgi:hypothetical protein
MVGGSLDSREFWWLAAELERLIPSDFRGLLNPGVVVEDAQLPSQLRLLYEWRNGQRSFNPSIFREWRRGSSGFDERDVILPFFFLPYEEACREFTDLDSGLRAQLGVRAHLIGFGYNSGIFFAAESDSGGLSIGSLCEDGAIVAEYDGLLNVLRTWVEAWRYQENHLVVAKKFSPRSGSFWDSIDDWIAAAP